MNGDSSSDDAKIYEIGCTAELECPIYDYYDSFSRLMLATRKRMLCGILKLQPNEAQQIINKYKEYFQCISVLVEYQ